MKTLALIDTESTDLSPEKGLLLEVGLVLWSVPLRSVIRARSWLVDGAEENPQKHTNGIDPKLLAHGSPREEVERQIHAIATKEADAFVAWNAEHDRAWFSPEVQKVKPWICGMDDFEWPKPSNSKGLAAVALAHGVGVVDAHRALPDCMTMARLFERAAELLDAQPRFAADGGLVDDDHPAPFEAWLAAAARPRAVYQITSRDDADAAKAAGFRWTKDEAGKWLLPRRRLAREDALRLPFKVQEVRP